MKPNSPSGSARYLIITIAALAVILLAGAGRRHSERCLADSRHAHQARRQGEVGLVDRQPASQELFEDFVLADPFTGRTIGLSKI